VFRLGKLRHDFTAEKNIVHIKTRANGIKMLNHMHTRFKVMNTRKETDLYEQFDEDKQNKKTQHRK
jgi:hypothetical protein